MLQSGIQAPEFSLPSNDGNKYNLADFKGSWILLFFYPADNTLFCTKEVCSVQNNFYELEKFGIKIFGINSDSIQSHKEFAKKHNLQYPLLSDSEFEVIKKYKAKGILTTKRISYLINPEGKIHKCYPFVNSFSHGSDILKDLKLYFEEYVPSR